MQAPLRSSPHIHKFLAVGPGAMDDRRRKNVIGCRGGDRREGQKEAADGNQVV